MYCTYTVFFPEKRATPRSPFRVFATRNTCHYCCVETWRPTCRKTLALERLKRTHFDRVISREADTKVKRTIDVQDEQFNSVNISKW